MRKERDRVWEEFNKRFGRLINAHNAILQRISQGNRLREGVSIFSVTRSTSITNMSQIGSVVGIEQNENISMLTWMTIIYLPLSFITVCRTKTGIGGKSSANGALRPFSVWNTGLSLSHWADPITVG